MTNEVKAAIIRARMKAPLDGELEDFAALFNALAGEDAVMRMMADVLCDQDEFYKTANRIGVACDMRAAVLALARECER